MITTIGTVLVVLLVYVPLPVAFAVGWMRWARRRSRLTVCSTLSLVGFALATASVLLAAGSIMYAHAIHGFRFYDPLLLRIYRSGGLLSLSGCVLGLAGTWRPSPLRWYAPLCSAGMLLFWFAMAMGE